MTEPRAEAGGSAETSDSGGGAVVQHGALVAPHTSMPVEEAAELVHHCFGIAGGRLYRLATEKDDTFRVEAEDGRRYVLKVANPREPRAEIEFQIELMRYVARTDPGIPIPRLIPDRHDRPTFPIVDRAGQPRHVRLMSYLEGTTLDGTRSTPEERFRVGQMLARLRYATAGFRHPADSRVLAWDVRHLPGLRPLLPHVEDRNKRERLGRGLDRFEIFGERIAKLRTQVLHNDFSRSNIIVDRGRPEFVTGIIDFADAVRTAVAIDVSTALLNQLPRNTAQAPIDDLFVDARDVLRGYLSVAELTEEELRLLPHLVMGRVIARALITLWRARLFPKNATYILRNTGPGWGQLDWFLQRTPDELSAALT